MHFYAEVSGFVWFKRSKPEMEIIATNNVKKTQKKKQQQQETALTLNFSPGKIWVVLAL